MKTFSDYRIIYKVLQRYGGRTHYVGEEKDTELDSVNLTPVELITAILTECPDPRAVEEIPLLLARFVTEKDIEDLTANASINGFQNQLGFLTEMAILLGQKYEYNISHLSKLLSSLESIKIKGKNIFIFGEEKDERLIKLDISRRSSVAEKWGIVDTPGWDRFEKKFRLAKEQNTNFCLQIFTVE